MIKNSLTAKKNCTGVPVLCFLLLTATATAQLMPNILFIFADDQSWETISAMAPPDMDSIVTPALDRLVDNGVAFTHADGPSTLTARIR